MEKTIIYHNRNEELKCKREIQNCAYQIRRIKAKTFFAIMLRNERGLEEDILVSLCGSNKAFG